MARLGKAAVSNANASLARPAWTVHELARVHMHLKGC